MSAIVLLILLSIVIPAALVVAVMWACVVIDSREDRLGE
jgi:hypothetical protein